jgi:hypothetical protein
MGASDIGIVGPLVQAGVGIGIGAGVGMLMGPQAGLLAAGAAMASALIRIISQYVPAVGVAMGDADSYTQVLGPSIPLNEHLAIVDQEVAAAVGGGVGGYIDQGTPGFFDYAGVAHASLSEGGSMADIIEDDLLEYDPSLGGYAEMPPITSFSMF